MTFDWNAIVREHGRAVFGVAFRILGHAADAEDVVQEVFLEAQQQRKPQRIRDWSAFIKRLATFRAIDCLRRRRGDQSLHGVSEPDRADGPQQSAIGNELQHRLRHSLTLLPDQQATIFCLRYFEDLSYEQIASSLGISVSAVSTSLNKARARLRELLKEKGDDN